MTMIDLDTSPLQAAREWRGIGLVAAARNSGLHVAQAEALEEGNPAAFESIDEMIASAVVYGASIGIGRDEAMALLDRTVCGTGAQVELPDPDEERPGAEFTEAVRSRSARIEGDAAPSVSAPAPLELDEEGLDHHPVLDPIRDEELVEGAATAAVDAMIRTEALDAPGGPTPEQAVQASGEIHIDSSFGPEAPWERAQPNPFEATGSHQISGHGELEAWAADDDYDGGYAGGGAVAARTRPTAGGVLARVGSGSHTAIERILGTDRADAAADWTVKTTERVREGFRSGRERLRQSEHATLIVAIGGGAVLIALLVAIGGALGGEDEPAGPGPAKRGPEVKAVGASGDVVAEAPATDATTATEAADATVDAPSSATPTTPVVAPSKLTVDVYNDGRQKGYAKTIAAQLGAADYGVGDVGNAKGDYPAAVVIYPKTMVREARALGRLVGIDNLQEAPGTSPRFTLVVK